MASNVGVADCEVVVEQIENGMKNRKLALITSHKGKFCGLGGCHIGEYADMPIGNIVYLRLFWFICDIFHIFATFRFYLRLHIFICDFLILFATSPKSPSPPTQKNTSPQGWCPPNSAQTVICQLESASHLSCSL
nr:hypothetical protein [Bacillus infantis]